MPKTTTSKARTTKLTASDREVAYQASAPNPNTRTSEQTNKTGRFQDASRRGPQKQMVFTDLQHAHVTVIPAL